MWTTPWAMFFFSLGFCRAAPAVFFAAILTPVWVYGCVGVWVSLLITPTHPYTHTVLLLRLLLAGNRALGTFADPRVGLGALAAHWETAAVAQAPIAADLLQPADVELE